MIRSPIIVTVGHSDHGKTTLLDKIRGTAVTKAEPGELTQSVGASYVPISVVEKSCGDLLKKFKIKLEVPGLLFIDTPGHVAFIGMRKRGGSVSDVAILVVDITEGFQEQSDESLNVLKQFKVPFVIAATKIDRIPGWFPHSDMCLLDSLEKQRDDVKEEFEKRVYRLVSQLSERNFDSERFDRIEDFTKQIAIVPLSSISGEGVPELMMVLAGLAQNFLKDKLKLSDTPRGTILEVKETKGLGMTVDVILFDGKIRKGDYLIIGGREPIDTKIKALLVPRPLQELRIEKQFDYVDEVTAAVGVKIAAPNLENVVAGSPVIAVRSEKDIEKAKQLVQKEVEEIEFKKDVEGIILKADTLGSLEAMIKILNEKNVPIRKAEVGKINREDLTDMENVKNDVRRVVLAFNVKVSDDIEQSAKDLNIKIFSNNIIYRLLEDYDTWVKEKTEREIREKLSSVSRPCLIRILPGFVFRQSNPAVFGVEIKKGVLMPEVRLKKTSGKVVGRVKEIQKEGVNIGEAKQGEKVAVSMEEPTIGRQVKEGDELISVLTEYDLKILKELFDHLSEGEKEFLKEFEGFS